jgi:hypothetical protein
MRLDRLMVRVDGDAVDIISFKRVSGGRTAAHHRVRSTRARWKAELAKPDNQVALGLSKAPLVGELP